jgi:hypothetical protein
MIKVFRVGGNIKENEIYNINNDNEAFLSIDISIRIQLMSKKKEKKFERFPHYILIPPQPIESSSPGSTVELSA